MSLIQAIALVGAIILASTVSTVGVLVVRDNTSQEASVITIEGFTGPRGYAGPRGPTGPNSTMTGPQGQTGFTGISSDQPGATGEQGIRGLTGPNGGISTITGATGPSGTAITGPTGQPGATGISGLIATGGIFSYHLRTTSGQFWPTSPTQATGLLVQAAGQSFLSTVSSVPTNGSTDPVILRITDPVVSCPTGTTMTIGSFSGITYTAYDQFIGTRTALTDTDFDLGFMSSIGIFTPLAMATHVPSVATFNFLITNPFF